MPIKHFALRRPIVAAALLFVASTIMAHSADGYVAPKGNDGNPGTLAQPYRTIQKCATTVTSGSTCFIRAGQYAETVTPNSGITIAPYNGEAVVVEGIDKVTGWTLYKGKIYRAKVTLSSGDTNQIFVNRQMMTEARWPKGDDLLHPVWATAKAGTTATELVDSSLPNINWVGAHVHFWSGTDPWSAQTAVVTTSSKGRLTFTVDGASFPPFIIPQPGGYYFLFGVLGALTTEGEWFYDANAGYLYLYAPGGVNPNSLSVSAKFRQIGFDLSGRSNVTIRGLHLFANTINTDTSSANNVIDGIAATYVSHFSTLPDPPGKLPHYYWYDHLDDSGIVLKGSGNTLKNSTISYSAGNGVTLLGTNHTVVNNLIHHVDYIANNTSGIAVEGAGHVISHNTIHTSGRIGIFIHSIFWTGSPPSPPAPTNIDISYNNLFNAMLLSRDAGEIYNAFQACAISSTIYHNWLHDTQSHYTGPADNYALPGVYLDEDACGWKVYQNVLWNNQIFNIFIHGSTSGVTNPNNNLVRNNSVIDINPTGYIWLQGVNHCGTTTVDKNYVLLPPMQSASQCRVFNNSASAPGADQMTGVKVGCDFAGCASSGPPKVVAGKVAASIAAQPFSVTVSVGESASFSVIGAGSAPLTYQWKKNGAAIIGATQAEYSTPNAQAADNGAVYSVVVANALGHVASDKAILTVR